MPATTLPTRAPRWTTDQWASALRECAKAHPDRPLTRNRYRLWRWQLKDPTVAPDASGRVTAERWAALCAAAGVEYDANGVKAYRYSDADLLHAVKDAAGKAGHVSITQYEAWSRRDKSRPTSRTVVTRFSSWTEACRRAGVGTGGPGGTHSVDGAAIIKALKAWRKATGDTKIRDYAAWAQPRKAPSVSTILRRYGTWGAALDAARQSR